MGWKLKSSVVAALVLAMGATLLWAARKMAPIKDGTSAGFWYAVCRVRLDNTHLFPGRVHGPKDGWFVYELAHMHGSDLLRVRVEDALADLPRVSQLLAETPPENMRPEVKEGYRTWRDVDPTASDGLALVEQMRAADRRDIERQYPDLSSYLSAKDASFEERWQRAERYHWNVIAEFLFLAGLILLAAWLWLRRGGRVRWALHLGMLPVLFFLPFWLGYAPLAFTSAGPEGGCLYPWLLVQFRRLPWTRLDTLIVSRLPHCLEPLTQTPGEMMVLSGGPGVGPVAACVLAILLAVLPFVVCAARSRRQRFSSAAR